MSSQVESSLGYAVWRSDFAAADPQAMIRKLVALLIVPLVLAMTACTGAATKVTPTDLNGAWSSAGVKLVFTDSTKVMTLRF